MDNVRIGETGDDNDGCAAMEGGGVDGVVESGNAAVSREEEMFLENRII